MNEDKKEYYYVYTPETDIYLDDEGMIWRGGSRIFLPIFETKEEARIFRKKAKKRLKIKMWTKIIPVKIYGGYKK